MAAAAAVECQRRQQGRVQYAAGGHGVRCCGGGAQCTGGRTSGGAGKERSEKSDETDKCGEAVSVKLQSGVRRAV